MSYLFGDVATWLIGKTFVDDDEEIVRDDGQDDDESKEGGANQNVGNNEGNGVEDGVTKKEGNEELKETGEEEKEAGASLEHDLGEVSSLAFHKAKDIGSYILNLGKSYSKQVAKTAQDIKGVIEEKTLIGEFSREQEKFLSTNKVKKVESDMAIPPWVGYNEEETMKKQILDLSKDKRNLLRDPPKGIQFNFDFDANHPLALTMLQLDPTLNSLRFKLVPKQIKEEVFWRNYFYRVSLIKQSTQLNSLTSPSETLKSESKAPSSSQLDQAIAEKEAKTEDEPEFVSDSFNSTNLGDDDDDLYNAMQQLNTKNPDDKEDEGEGEEGEGEGISEWEAELQAELQEYEVVSDDTNYEALEQEIMQQLHNQPPPSSAVVAKDDAVVVKGDVVAGVAKGDVVAGVAKGDADVVAKDDVNAVEDD